MKEVYVGLDVHSKKIFYVIQDSDGNVTAEGTIPTHREGIHSLVDKYALEAGTQVCMESGVQAGFVCDALVEQGLKPLVIDAHEVRKKARRTGQKTDRRDAFEICDGLRRGIWYSAVYMPPSVIRKLRRILSRRRHFVRLSTQQINAGRFLFRRECLWGKAPACLSTAGGWKKALANDQAVPIREHLHLHAKTWELANTHINLLEQELLSALEPVKDVMDWLTSVPSVGLITAATFIAIVGDPTRFRDSNHLVSYLGLAPSMYDSGETERHGHITKAGPPQMRALLCEIAQQTAKRTHPLNPYFVRVAAKSGYKKAAIAIAQRLARIMYRIWLNKERFDVSKLNVERDGTARTRIYDWKIKKPTLKTA
ncbi:MAG: IS110 family transposase [Verrucomicrobiae bacterium]|jgi:transposase|nr:IS110 family transposase [Verrucomicrobiae bacterium]